MAGVSWDFQYEDLKEIASLLGGPSLAEICELLLKDFRNRSGMPDLCIWNDSSVIFSEVKGPGDTLSEKQEIWLHELNRVGVVTQLCLVREECMSAKDANNLDKKRKKSKP